MSHVTLCSLSLIASGVALAQSDDAGSTTDLGTVTVTAANIYENVGYTRRTTSAGTRFELSPREVPQSISIITEQRIEDQNLQTVESVLANTTGISASKSDSTRVNFYSRGFRINNYQFDGIPTTVAGNWYFGDGAMDTAIYDRVEVVRGATGLLTGTGSPAASVNFVRKHAKSRELTGTVSGTLGSWDERRGVVDVTSPLTASGDVRARFIGGYDSSNSFMDRYEEHKKFAYGVIDVDVTDTTTLSIGYEYQDTHSSDPTWGGFPMVFSDGSRTDFSRSFSVAPDWTYYDYESEKVFVDLNHRFGGNGWEWRGSATHATMDVNSKLLYLIQTNAPDRETGLGMAGAGYGKYHSKRRLDAVDTYVRGPFTLLGREHQLVTGISYSEQKDNHESYWGPKPGDADGDVYSDIGSIYDWDGSIAEPNFGEMTDAGGQTVRQRAVYTVGRFSLADPLTLILGARYTDWSSDSPTQSYGKEELTPYGGLVYNINETWSVFASYTEIFLPQSYRDTRGAYLDPVQGKSYEAGIKAAWFDGLLNASFSVFRIEQDNVAQRDGDKTVGNIAEFAYYAAQGVVSEGFDFEISGAVTNNLDLTLGVSHYTATDQDGSVNTQLPRTQLDLFSSYRVPQWQPLTIGGGVNWQSDTFDQSATLSDGSVKDVTQGSYALFNVFGRYQFTSDLSLQANVYNLFDKEYYSRVGTYGVYGEPRSVRATLTYAF